MTISAEDVKSQINFREYFQREFPEKYRDGQNSFHPFNDDGNNPDFTLYERNGIDQHSGKSYDIFDLRQAKYSETFDQAVNAIADQYGIQKPTNPKKSTSWGELLKTYSYQDEAGRLHVQHLRYENKQFPWQRPDPDNPGQMIKKDVFKDYRRIPYRLPQLLGSDRARPVIITEGEKDADATAKLGYVSTTFGGKNDHTRAIKDDQNVEYFRDRIVWLIADKDCKKGNKENPRGDGYIAFRQLAGVLSQVASEVKLFLLPGRQVKDAADLIELFGPQRAKKIIEKQAKRAPVFVQRRKTTKTRTTTVEQAQEPVKKLSKGTVRFQMLDECFESMDVSLFFDQTQTPWASVRIGDHYENIPVASSTFKRILRKEFYKRYADGVGGQTIENLLDVKLGLIQHTQPPRPLQIRSCWNDSRDRILIDSGRPDWAVYEIGPDGWSMVYLEKNPFKRGVKTAPFSCNPDTPRATWDNLFKLCRAKDDIQQTIIKMWPCLALFPDTDRPALVITGPHGSSKTTQATVLKMIVDPATNFKPKRLRSDANDMLASLGSYAVSVLDNATQMSPEISDLLCQTITGLDDEKRRLFTDGDVFNTEIRSTWILTSLNNPGKMGDFLSRVFLVEVGLLSGEDRKRKRHIEEQTAQYLPGLQALIFDCMSAALRRHNEITETKLPRLDDAYIYSLAMAEELGVEKDDIRKAWESNRINQDAEVSAGEILCELIPEFLKKQKGGQWAGTSKELLEHLSDHFNVDDQPWKKSFPATPVHLSRRINLIQENLANQGIDADLRKRNKSLRLMQPAKGESTDPVKHEGTPTECKNCVCYGNNHCGLLDGKPDPEHCDRPDSILHLREPAAASC